MSFEAIIGFLIIAAISSFFNKAKESGNKRPGTPQGQNRPTVRPTQTRPQPTQSMGRPGQRRPAAKPTGGLGELFKELQKDLNEVFGEVTKGRPITSQSQQSEPNKGTTQEEQPEIIEKSKILKRDQTIKKSKYDNEDDPIQASEIGREDLVSFDRKSILQGIIMSEVLGKPKSRR